MRWVGSAGVPATAADEAAAFAFVFVAAADCYSRPKRPPLVPTWPAVKRRSIEVRLEWP